MFMYMICITTHAYVSAETSTYSHVFVRTCPRRMCACTNAPVAGWIPIMETSTAMAKKTTQSVMAVEPSASLRA